MWPRDLEWRGGRGGGHGLVTSRTSGRDFLLRDAGAETLSSVASVWVSASIRGLIGFKVVLDVRSVQESAEEGSRDRWEGEVKFLLRAVRSGLWMREPGGGGSSRGWGAHL